MMNKLLIISLSFTLTGCVGAVISGQTELIDEDFPDITTVPCREAATRDRGVHFKKERTAREEDLQRLKSDREQSKERARDLRDEKVDFLLEE